MAKRKATRPHPLRDSRTLSHARQLRRALTDEERLLWAKLRNRRFGTFTFRRQVPLGPFIVDFLCLHSRLVVELDGGQHTIQRDYDTQRSRWLAQNGFRIVRFWNHELREDSDAVEELIWRRLHDGE